MQKIYKDQGWLYQMYEVEQLEVWQIAKLGNTSVKMIHEWLQRYGFYSMDEAEFEDIP